MRYVWSVVCAVVWPCAGKVKNNVVQKMKWIASESVRYFLFIADLNLAAAVCVRKAAAVRLVCDDELTCNLLTI